MVVWSVIFNVSIISSNYAMNVILMFMVMVMVTSDTTPVKPLYCGDT